MNKPIKFRDNTKSPKSPKFPLLTNTHDCFTAQDA